MDITWDRQKGDRPAVRPACLVPGCPCSDPRIISSRRACVLRPPGKEHGETADRIVAPTRPGLILRPRPCLA